MRSRLQRLPRLRPDAAEWTSGPAGAAPWPLAAAVPLAALLALWTLPQTLAGLAFAAALALGGHRPRLYRFGPFLFLVVPAAPFSIYGISLGLVVLADHPSILTHEFCHLYTGLWLGWLYLPIYGIEYLVLGHDRSPHERLTVWIASRTMTAWWASSRAPRRSRPPRSLHSPGAR